MDLGLYLTIGGIIVGAFFAIWGAIIQNNEKIKSNLKSDSLAIENKKADEAARESAKEIKELQIKSNTKADELVEAYKENAKLSNEIKNQLTGGDNYPVLEIYIHKYFLTTMPSENIHVSGIEFHLRNNGEYPLQDVKLLIRDWHGKDVLIHRAKYEPKDGKLFTDLLNDFKTEKWYDVGTIPKRTTLEIYNTCISPELCFTYEGKRDVTFGGFITWNQGKIQYSGIGFDAKDTGLVNDGMGLMVNGIKIEGKNSKDYEKYIKIIYKD
ncbi:MAG: hypothetical protein ACYDEC_17445 [Bacteroidia bacterium]